jgi:hypothetical protein
METRHDFRLAFNSSLGGLMQLTIPRARASATGQQVADAMEAMVAAQAIQNARGTPVSRHSAELITTTTTEFDVR